MRKFLRLFLISGAILTLNIYPSYAARGTSDNKAGDILRDGLFGAGVGAISAKASGGKAGKGALVGAGANVVGNLLVDSLTGSGQQAAQQQQPQYQQPQYYDDQYYQQPAPQYVRAPQASAHSAVQRAYDQGYEEGYRIGYRDGLRDGKSGY